MPQYYGAFSLLPGNRRKTQGVVYNVSIDGPGTSPWGTTYAAVPISLGDTSAGKLLDIRREPEKLEALQSGYVTMPGMTEEAYRTFLQDWNNADRRKFFMPARLKVELVQTKKPSQAALFLSEVLGRSKTKFGEYAGGQFAPGKGLAESQARMEAEIAYLEAKKALSDLQATASPDADQLEILKLKRDKAKEKFESLEE